MGELADEYSGVASPMDQTLSQFIFPGSHDAGTYAIKLAPACDACRGGLRTITEVPGLALLIGDLAGPWSQAQGQDIYGQLHAGSRVFDLRFFEATPGDVSYAQDFNNSIQSVIPFIGDYLDLTPLEVGKYYIHHTFSGPSSDEIWAGISAYLAEPGHDDEIIILNLSQMRAATGDMNAVSLRNFMREMYDAIGPQYFVPYASPWAGMTLADIQNNVTRPEQQIIAVLDADIPAWTAADDDIRNLNWARIQSAYFGTSPAVVSSGGGYPTPDDWDCQSYSPCE